MANWATLYRQPSKLTVLSPAADPKAEWFRCDRFACRLPKTSCVSRYKLSQGSTREGLSYEAVTYGACRKCVIGAAHARGEPTPQEERVMETIETNGVNGKTLSDRRCVTCKSPFIPQPPNRKQCDSCKATKTGKPARRVARAKVVLPKLKPVVAAEVRKQHASAVEVLELAGYKVQVLSTPAGVLLKVG